MPVESNVQKINRNASRLFQMVWDKSIPVENTELSTLVEDTRQSYLMLNSLEVKAFNTNKSPTWLTDSLDTIEDSMGINDAYTAANLMFNSNKIPKYNEVSQQLGLLVEFEKDNKRINEASNLFDDLEYKAFKLYDSGSDKGISKTIAELDILINKIDADSHVFEYLSGRFSNISTFFNSDVHNATINGDLALSFAKMQTSFELARASANTRMESENCPQETYKKDKVRMNNQFTDNLVAAVSKESTRSKSHSSSFKNSFTPSTLKR
ncbi:hypothetical protein [Vibrio sp. D431a]|uniref:hypothetical protein n=1 Tax=Vibrio sp. D431a TaxID=2837388 RepID=UPI0025566787|nr:hypothetical protein [Vibrio sp. D431a]MDK9790195.1 hypothetical protein [Vibrio sp. D431a]